MSDINEFLAGLEKIGRETQGIRSWPWWEAELIKGLATKYKIDLVYKKNGNDYILGRKKNGLFQEFHEFYPISFYEQLIPSLDKHGDLSPEEFLAECGYKKYV